MMTGFRNWLSVSPEPTPRIRPRQAWLVAIPAAYLLVVGACWRYGTPSKLPGVALGLPLLLDLERAAAIVAALAAILIFAYLTSRGFLPTVFGNVSYPDALRQHEIDQRVAELDGRIQRRLEPLEEGKSIADEALPLIQRELERLDVRLGAVED